MNRGVWMSVSAANISTDWMTSTAVSAPAQSQRSAIQMIGTNNR